MVPCSRSQVSNVERGEIGGITIAALTAVAGALGAEAELRIRWHGEGLDRLLDEAHANLVNTLVEWLGRSGWTCEVETSFSEWGERGSIDVLAWNPRNEAVLVCEVKSVVPDIQAMLHALDRKARLAGVIASRRGWEARVAGRLLVIADSTTTRRRVASHQAIFAAALPGRGTAVRAWLRRPVGELRGLAFLPDATKGGTRRPAAGRQRMTRPAGHGVRP